MTHQQKRYLAILMVGVFIAGFTQSRLDARLHNLTSTDIENLIEDVAVDTAEERLESAVRAVVIGQASWYSEKDPGILKTTANNEIFDDSQLTAAMWDVPFNQRVRVTNMDNGKSVVVRVNDRGPHRRFVAQGRLIDLSKAAFAKIGNHKNGLINVKLEFL